MNLIQIYIHIILEWFSIIWGGLKIKRYIIILSIILAVLFAISAVSANENITDEIASSNEIDSEIIGENITDEIISTDADNEEKIGNTSNEVREKEKCEGYISTDAYSDVYYKNTKTVIAYMEDMPKNANGKLVLYENNNVIASKSLSNGKATIKLSDLTIQPSNKEHAIVAKYEGDDYYVDDYDIDLKVIYYTLVGTECYAGGTAKFTITLPTDATGTVTMSGSKTGSAKISNGKAVITVPNLKLGVYSLYFKYSNSKYGFSDSILYFTVYPKTFKAPTYEKKIVAGRDKFFTIAFPKASSGTVSVKVYNVKTEKSTTYKVSYKNGKASFDASKLAAGHYMLLDYKIKDSTYGTLNFKNTPQFIAEGLFGDFKVLYPKLTLKKAKIKKSAKKVILVVNLGKVNKKYLSGKKIVFKFKGKKYTAKTNSKGVAKVTIEKSVLKKLKVGKKITYTATYFKKTVKKTVKVKK